MADRIMVRLLGGFVFTVNGEKKDDVISKSKKGLALIQYLMVRHPAAVSTDELIDVLWQGGEGGNPESALKTLVSRFRSLLNQCAPGLGNCLAASRGGGYQFQPLPGMQLDLLEFRQVITALEKTNSLTPETREKFRRMLYLYGGDLLADSTQADWVVASGVNCHERYISVVYRFISMLREAGDYDAVIENCRLALEKDAFDERLHLELMQALVKQNRGNEALSQYKHVTNMHFRYLGVKPPESIQKFYRQIMKSGDSLEMDLDMVRGELESYGEMHGAFECSYPVFREVYNLQVRNLQRLNADIYLAMVRLSSVDGQPLEPIRLDETMKVLGEVLRKNLRRGDTITQYSPIQYCLLLPMVNDDTGHMVMERIKRFFYQRFPDSSIIFTYRLSLLKPEDKHSRGKK